MAQEHEERGVLLGVFLDRLVVYRRELVIDPFGGAIFRRVLLEVCTNEDGQIFGKGEVRGLKEGGDRFGELLGRPVREDKALD